MLNNTNNSPLFYEYYAQWVDVYKKGAIREATMAKYLMTQKWIQKLAPELKVSELTRTAYQQILNDYAKEHERQTTLDFHHQLKGAILDALPIPPVERRATPASETPMAAAVRHEIRSRKKSAMARATASGYMKWMIEATPLEIF